MNRREDLMAALVDRNRAHVADMRPWARAEVLRLLAGCADPAERRRRLGALAVIIRDEGCKVDGGFSTRMAALGHEKALAPPPLDPAPDPASLFHKPGSA